MSDLLERLSSALGDRYTTRSEIGRGGMAIVFLAEDLKHHRKVAIKVLHPELAAAVGPDRFLREIEAVARLTHPHIVPLHNSGEADGLLFYVMPYIDGESLRQRLDRERQLPVGDAVRIAQEVAEALDYAHRHGLIHRDIKPGNILLEDGHAVVTDFGVARAITAAGGERVTATGMAVGTPAYMSPEQAAGEEVDVRSDVYSLGCVLYEMLAGEPPYTGLTPQSVLAKRMSEPVPQVSTLRDTVPPEVEHAITRALAKTAADRFPTAAAFGDSLSAVAAPAAPAGSGHRQGLRRRTVVGLVGIVVVAALAAAIVRGWVRPAAAGPASVAVLPCTDRIGDPDQEYIPAAVHDEVIDGLSRIASIEVRGRMSVERYRDSDATPSAIARDLGVRGLVDCSVYRAGDSVRVTASLLDAIRDRQLWSHTFQRPSSEVYLLGSDIAGGVADVLSADVTSAERVGVAGPPTDNQVALTHYHRGRYLVDRWTPEGIQAGIDHLGQAIALDSSFALAYAGLGEALILQGDIMGRGDVRPVDFMPRARELLLKALELDAELAEAHYILGYVRWNYDYDYAAAERELRLATQLGPTSAAAWNGLATFLSMMGRHDEALVAGRRAMELDPVSASIHSDQGALLLAAGEYQGALEIARVAMELDPALPSPYGIAGGALFSMDRAEEAIRIMERADSLSDHPLYRGLLALAYGNVGNRDKTLEILRELLEMRERRYVPPRAIASAYRGLDSLDAAMDWLIEAAETRDPSLHWDIRSSRLREHPRYPELLSLMRLDL